MLVLAMGLILLSAAEPQPVTTSKGDAGEVAKYLPSKGFSPIGPVEHFSGKKLFDYMNGGAELYLAYGFVDLVVREYQANDTKAFVALYRMREPTGAFGIHLTAASGKPVNVGGVPGVVSAGMISFFKGKIYVRVVSRATQADKKSNAFLLELARNTALKIPGDAKPPIRIDSMLPAGYARGSLRYLNSPDTTQTIWFGDEGKILLSEKAWALTAFYPQKQGDLQLTRVSYPQENNAVTACRKLANELGLALSGKPEGCVVKGKGSDDLYHFVSVRGSALGWVAAAPDEATAASWIKKIDLSR